VCLQERENLLAELAAKEEAATARVSAAEVAKAASESEKEGLRGEVTALAKKVKEAEQAVARAVSESAAAREKLDSKIQNQRQVDTPPPPP